MVRYRMFALLILMLSQIAVQAQDAASDAHSTPTVRALFTTPALPDGDLHYGGVSWSPNGHYTTIFYRIPATSTSQLGPRTDLIYDLRSGQQLLEVKDFAGWMPDGEHLVARAADGGWMPVLEVVTGEMVMALSRASTDIVSSPDGRWVATMNGEELAVYDAETGERLLLVGGIAPEGFDWSPHSNWIAANGLDGSVRVYEAAKGILVDRLDDHILPWRPQRERPIWSPDGKKLLVRFENFSTRGLDLFQLWRPGESLSSIFASTSSNIIWSPDSSQIAIGSDETEIYIRDSATGELIITLHMDDALVWPLDWSEDGRWLIAVNDQYLANGFFNIMVWDFTNDIWTVNARVDVGYSAHFETNQLELTMSFYGRMRYDLETGDQIYEARISDGLLLWLSPDRRWAVAPDERAAIASVGLFRAEDGIQVASLPAASSVRHAVWSPDSRKFAVIADEAVTVWVFED